MKCCRLPRDALVINNKSFLYSTQSTIRKRGDVTALDKWNRIFSHRANLIWGGFSPFYVKSFEEWHCVSSLILKGVWWTETETICGKNKWLKNWNAQLSLVTCEMCAFYDHLFPELIDKYKQFRHRGTKGMWEKRVKWWISKKQFNTGEGFVRRTSFRLSFVGSREQNADCWGLKQPQFREHDGELSHLQL